MSELLSIATVRSSAIGRLNKSTSAAYTQSHTTPCHMAFHHSQLGLLSALENALIRILTLGPIPQHVAFIMDGNRRWARLNDKQPYEGHSDGYAALRRVRLITLISFFRKK
jgi:hypothetical protein